MSVLHGKLLFRSHYRGELADGQKFVYCPAGKIVSWNAEDYNHKWCHFCQKYYES